MPQPRQQDRDQGHSRVPGLRGRTDQTARLVPAALAGSNRQSQTRAGTSSTPPPIPSAPLTLPTISPMTTYKIMIFMVLSRYSKMQNRPSLQELEPACRVASPLFLIF